MISPTPTYSKLINFIYSAFEEEQRSKYPLRVALSPLYPDEDALLVQRSWNNPETLSDEEWTELGEVQERQRLRVGVGGEPYNTEKGVLGLKGRCQRLKGSRVAEL